MFFVAIFVLSEQVADDEGEGQLGIVFKNLVWFLWKRLLRKFIMFLVAVFIQDNQIADDGRGGRGGGVGIS